MLRSVTYTFEISAVDFSGEWVPHKFLGKVFGQLDLKRFEPSDGVYWLTGQLFVETARWENISRLHIRPTLFLDIYLLLPTCPLYHINKLKYNKTMCTNERGARDIWTLIFLLTTTWRNRMPAIYCSDLPYDSWVWGPHSGGWLAGWCLNMEHNCGLFMVMLFYMYAMGSKPYVETCNWAENICHFNKKIVFF